MFSAPHWSLPCQCWETFHYQVNELKSVSYRKNDNDERSPSHLVTSPISALPLLTTGLRSFFAAQRCQSAVRCSAEILASTQLDTISTIPPPVVFAKNISRHCQMSPGGQSHYPLTTLITTCLDYTNHHMDIFKTQFFIITASNIYYMLIYYVICTG